MHQNLKKFFTKAIIILLFIHLGYFIYGFFNFVGLKNINIYTEFYRFKFYDDVSISHFMISGLFLCVFLIFLIKNHSKHQYSFQNLLIISMLILLISLLTFSFFISYSFGLNAKLKSELSEKDFDKDKTLLNILHPFLYNYTSYSSEKLFNVTNIIYPKPYPLVEAKDTLFYDSQDKGNYNLENSYYSIDTLKLLTKDYRKIAGKTNSILITLGFDLKEFKNRIISKKIINDSTELVFRGQKVNPDYDTTICIFLKNNTLISPIRSKDINLQIRKNAKKRYELLYKFEEDSLLNSFEKLDTLFKKYAIESQIKPRELTKDIFYYRDNNKEYLNEIRNTFDRKALNEQIGTLDKLFYQPNYLHPSIRLLYFTVIFSIWLLLSIFFILFNIKNKK